MKIYIDFDDVISETGRYLSGLAKELFGIILPYERMMYFNLQQAFGLDGKQYDELLREGHVTERLLSIEETPSASDIINKWVDEGHEIFVITGRPFAAYEASRKWLDNHNLRRIPLFCVDKYGRENLISGSTYNLALDDLYKMNFEFAIEDSPSAFTHLLHFDHCRVAVFDRPWNKLTVLPDENFKRCKGWMEIDRYLEENSVNDKR